MRKEINEKGQFINWKSKRGSEMMEAALVFPMVIITAMIMLSVMIGMYSEAETMAYTQVGLLAKGSTYKAHMIGGSPLRDPEDFGTVTKDKGLVDEEYTSEFGTTAKFGNSFISGRKHRIKISILDEMGYIRCLDAGKWVLQGFS